MIDLKNKTNIKIKPNELGLDIDDVVADFVPLFLQVLKEDTGIILSLEDITDFNVYNIIDLPKKQLSKVISKTVNNPIELDMKMKTGAKNVIEKLLDRGPVTFVTARKNGKLITQWIHNELGFSDIVVVAKGGHNDKAKALKRRGIKWFVDDRLETCYQVHEEGITPIVFTQPHNAGDNSFMRVNNWQEIDSLIDWSN